MKHNKRVVETDKLGGYFPNEKFLNIPPLPETNALKIARLINESFLKDYDRYWKVVDEDYVLQPGFEP